MMLALDTYPEAQRRQAEAAIQAVLDMEPLPEGALPDHGAAGTLSLPQHAPVLITLCGLPRAGKDTAADYLHSRYAGVMRLAFSTPILAEVNEFLAPHGHRISEANKSDARYRRLLQCWGAGRRQEDPDWWTTQLLAQMSRAWDNGMQLVILSGARDPGDFSFVRSCGGDVWRVTRPGHNPVGTDHPLEQYVTQLDARSVDVELINHENQQAAYHAQIEQALRQR